MDIAYSKTWLIQTPLNQASFNLDTIPGKINFYFGANNSTINHQRKSEVTAGFYDRQLTWHALLTATVSTITTKPTSLRISCSKMITDNLCFVTYSILLTIAVHYNNVNMYVFYCLIIIMTSKMVLSCVYFLFMQLPLLFNICVNPVFY
jgi:hypothetical protein